MSTGQLTGKRLVTFASAPTAGANTGCLLLVGSSAPYSLFYDSGSTLIPLDLQSTIPVVIIASESLAAGAFVNIWNSGGTTNVRNTNATAYGKHAHGFVLSSFASSANALVYLQGVNTALSGLVGGDVYITTTAGAVSNTPPSGVVGSGNVVQNVGVAISSTAVFFRPQIPLTL